MIRISIKSPTFIGAPVTIAFNKPCKRTDRCILENDIYSSVSPRKGPGGPRNMILPISLWREMYLTDSAGFLESTLNWLSDVYFNVIIKFVDHMFSD
jgi:hypothetical protein